MDSGKLSAYPFCTSASEDYNKATYKWTNDTTIFFDTKSSPPIPFLKKLSEQFPSVIFDLIYTDDTGGGAGNYKIRNGGIRLLVTNDVTIEEWCFIRANLCNGGIFGTARKFTLTDIWSDVKMWAKLILKVV